MAAQILVVEDDGSVARTLVRLLERATGKAVLVAASAAEARRRLEEQDCKWAGVVVDVGLPEGSTAGVDLLAHIRHSFPTMPAIVVSGCVDRAAMNAAAALDVCFVCKPAADAEFAPFVARVAFADARDSAPGALAEAAARRFGLTARERQVLASAIEGETSASFCVRVGISQRTFRAHAAGVIGKSGAASLRELALKLMRDGR